MIFCQYILYKLKMINADDNEENTFDVMHVQKIEENQQQNQSINNHHKQGIGQQQSQLRLCSSSKKQQNKSLSDQQIENVINKGSEKDKKEQRRSIKSIINSSQQFERSQNRSEEDQFAQEQRLSKKVTSQKEDSQKVVLMNSQSLRPLRSSTGHVKKKFKIIKGPRELTRKETPKKTEKHFYQPTYENDQSFLPQGSSFVLKQSFLVQSRRNNVQRSDDTQNKLSTSKNSYDTKNQFRRNQSIVKGSPKRNMTEADINGSDENLKRENSILKKRNGLLVKQLKQISAKIDKAIERKSAFNISTTKKPLKPRVSSVDSINHFELKNAYKMCDIYKKQIEQLKKKTSIYTQQKIDRLLEQNKRLKKMEQQLMEDNKGLKKTNRKYQKMVAQIGDGDYLRLRTENQTLKSDLKKLKNQFRKQEQQERIKALQRSNEKIRRQNEKKREIDERKKMEQKQDQEIQALRNKLDRDDKKIKNLELEKKKTNQNNQQLRNQLIQKDKQLQGMTKIIQNLRKITKKKKRSKENSSKISSLILSKRLKNEDDQRREENFTQFKNLEQRSDKLEGQIRLQEGKWQQQQTKQQEKNFFVQEDAGKSKQELQQQQNISNIKEQNLKEAQKNKEKQQCQQKYDEEILSKQQQEKQEQHDEVQDNQKPQKEQEEPKQKPQKKEKGPDQKLQKEEKGSDQKLQKEEKGSDQKLQKEEKQKLGNKKAIKKYPYQIEIGESMDSSYKWNHHTFSSKIKQIQVMEHPNGHVKHINFRYQKGEPPKPQQGNYRSFCCDESSDQYIEQIEGGFKGGILYYIKSVSSAGRVTIFCKFDLQESCKKFIFGAKNSADEYIGGFFGEEANQSIIRIGCYIQANKK